MRILPCFAALIALLAQSLSSDVFAREMIPCGKPYEVADGDTLRTISMRAYGTRDHARAIYDLNKPLPGAEANGLEVGTHLWLPCHPKDRGAPRRS